MEIRRGRLTVVLASTIIICGQDANADVSISNKATANMSCDAGVCTATAQKAVLNVGELQTMLGSGDVNVKTGALAKDIEIAQPLAWASTSRLTLDAQRSVAVKKPVTVAGQGALTVTTNDGGKHGEFIIDPKGNVQFWDLASSLVIDGHSYTLVGDIMSLAADIAAKPSGRYALAMPYDASPDGTYSSAPIAVTFGGKFEGLGNEISNLKIFFVSLDVVFGLFAEIGPQGTVRQLRLVNVDLENGSADAFGGGVAGYNQGLIDRAWVQGSLSVPGPAGDGFGGITGINRGKITRTYTNMTIQTEMSGGAIGGLVGANDGVILQSFSQGNIASIKGSTLASGGLAGTNAGSIADSYSMTSVHDGREGGGSYGGLVGENDSGASITASYAGGKTKAGSRARNAVVGGLIGNDKASAGSIAVSYWNLDKGVSDPAHGAGNILNDPGITGLTTEQFQAALPPGLNPSVWGLDVHKNHGFPYLLANPGR